MTPKQKTALRIARDLAHEASEGDGFPFAEFDKRCIAAGIAPEIDTTREREEFELTLTGIFVEQEIAEESG